MSASLSFKESVAQIQARLAERLRTFRPGPRAYATAFCVGATIGEYAALASAATPQAILTAVTALSTQLGVNLLADIIGEREPPSGLTAEEIAQAVQERLERGDDLPAVRALFQEFGVLQLALETWRQAEDDRWQWLVDELSRHPQLIATQVTHDMVAALDPRLATLEERIQCIHNLLQGTIAKPSVYVSVVWERLQPHREAVIRYLTSTNYNMIFDQQGGELPVEQQLELVKTCDLFAAILIMAQVCSVMGKGLLTEPSPPRSGDLRRTMTGSK